MSIMDTADYTANTTQQDIDDNKALAIIGYFGLLFLVPLLAGKTSKFAQFHANQSLVLFITQIAFSIASSILTFIFAFINLGILMTLVSFVGGIGLFVLFILGIVNAANGRCKELPIIGQFHIIK